jgi:(2Fe-2S) ferredoxin
MRSYGRQAFLCFHGNCSAPEAVLTLHQRFMELSREYGLTKLRNPQRVKCTLADCLGVCAGGPILVVYPEGIWYHHVDLESLERIFHQHIVGGQPVDELVFHRLYPQSEEPAYAPDVRGDMPFHEPPTPGTPGSEDDLPSEEEPYDIVFSVPANRIGAQPEQRSFQTPSFRCRLFTQHPIHFAQLVAGSKHPAVVTMHNTHRRVFVDIKDRFLYILPLTDKLLACGWQLHKVPRIQRVSTFQQLVLR